MSAPSTARIQMSQAPPSPRTATRPPPLNFSAASGSGDNQFHPPLTAHPLTGQTTESAGWPFFSASDFARRVSDFVDFTKAGMSSGERFTFGLYEKLSKWSRKWFTHIFLFIILVLYSVGGALLFISVEGLYGRKLMRDLSGARKNFLNDMRVLAQDPELQADLALFEGKVVNTLREHKDAVESLINNDSPIDKIEAESNPWTFINSMFFCGTIYTTIGYGHIAPVTVIGRALAIVYAIIGIPLFLLILADYGKLFTRGMKFLWVYVRRLYYTGTCRKIRKHQHVRDAMQMAHRNRVFFWRKTDVESNMTNPETPSVLFDETYEVDDEFNLPISVASSILVGYMLLGAFFYTMWEDWTYFEAFYFVFISMSTIGFGDLVPNRPFFMMCSILYMVFGLAFMSMFINVVQIKLTDKFKQASIKISTNMGIELPPEEDDTPGSRKQSVTTANGRESQTRRASSRPASAIVSDDETPRSVPNRQRQGDDDAGNKRGWGHW